MSVPQTEVVQRFRATNGRVTGILGLVVCVAAVVAFVLVAPAHVAVPGVIGTAFVAVLLYGAMLRPQVSASGDLLLMRTLFESVSIPLASIDTVVVRRYLLVRSGGNKYICPAISRSLRKTVRSELKWRGGAGNLLSPDRAISRMGSSETDARESMDYPDFVEQRILSLAAEDRARRGIEARSEEEYALGSDVRREPAWPVIAGLAVTGVAFVVALVV